MTVSDWLPDWKDPTQYPDGSESPTRFAWEFLRRNPDYQADFAEYCRQTDAGVEFDYDPPLQDGESHSDYLSRVGNVYRSVSISRLFLDKWGLLSGSHYRVPNPAGPGANFKAGIGTSSPGPESDAFQDDTKLILSFDLSLPLKIQFDRALAYAKFDQEMFRQRGGQVRDLRPRIEKFPHYLRVLDAKLWGHTNSEIAAQLLPHIEDGHDSGHIASKRIHDDLRAAQRLRDLDYRWLPLADQWNKTAL